MTSHRQPSNVVKFPPIGECDDDLWMRVPQNDPRPNLFDSLAAENLQREKVGRFGFANRATRLSARARILGLVHTASVAIAANFIPAACGLLVGMLATVGLAYCWAMFL